MLQFVLDYKHAGEGKKKLTELCRRVQEEAVEAGRNCVPSAPCCYLVDIGGEARGLSFEVLWYIEEYNDDIQLYKQAKNDVLLSILEILADANLTLARPPTCVAR